MLVLSSIVAVAFSTTMTLVPIFAPSAPVSGQDPAKASIESAAAPTTFATLRSVKAVPMAPAELGAVKGADAHFVTSKSKNELFGVTGLHVVNRNNRDIWVDLGNGILVGPGYHGLCDAALKSPNMFIPGQNPGTGIGGGC